MKATLLFLFVQMPIFMFAQVNQKHRLEKDRLSIQFDEGTWDIIPLSGKTIRVQWEKGGMKEERKFLLVNKLPVPVFEFSETGPKLKLSTNAITDLFDEQTGAIDHSDNAGKIFVGEKTGSRKLMPDTISGQSCVVAEQSFNSTSDEFLFGLAQAQAAIK